MSQVRLKKNHVFTELIWNSTGSEDWVLQRFPVGNLAYIYTGYSKVRTRNAIGPYGRAMPRGIGPP